MRFRVIFSIIGFLIVLSGITMIFPAILDWLDDNIRTASIFSITAALSVAVGLIILLLTDSQQVPLKTKEMFLTTTLAWVAFIFLCALPLYFSIIELSFTSALFESASGLTTTGATVLTGLDELPRGILLWRSMMHWMGGLGILVVAILVMPALHIGGMQLFNIESSGESDRDAPTMLQNLTGIFGYFCLMTLIVTGALWLGGMNSFDALNHAMSVVATGGFSTHDESIGYFHSSTLEWILSFFMFIGGLPMMLFVLFIRRHFDAIRKNEQIRYYILFCTAVILFLAFVRWQQNAFDNAELPAIMRTTVFDVFSVVTSTGFIIDNYESWGTYATVIFMILMLVGACTGSTAGGIKVFRLTVLFKTIASKLKSATRPHGIFIPRYGDKALTEDVVSGVTGIIGLYAICACAGTLIFSLYDLDTLTAFSGTVSMLSNMGPALGAIIGPEHTYTTLPEGLKALSVFLMTVGRLEFIAVFIILMPFFWKKNI